MNNMKIVLILFAVAGLAFASVNPRMQLMNYSISENPAEPGHSVNLTLHLKSMEFDNCAENVAVQLLVSYPLSLSGSDTQYLGDICFQDPQSRSDVSFVIPVDNLAQSGTYPVSIATTYEKRFTKFSDSNTVNLRVGGAPHIEATVASSNPIDIYPGDSAKVTIAIQNTGSSMVQSARATATSSGIEVKWAGQSQDIGQIAARGSSDAVFTIEAPKNLTSGTYPLKLVVDYISENRSIGRSEFTLDVPVKPKADFDAHFESGSMLAGEKREIGITLTNTGTDAAKRMKVRIKPLYPFSTDGTVRYIDSLAPGANETLDYVITVDKEATAGEQVLSFVVDFEDSQGKKFSDTADFSLPVRTPTLADDAVNYWYVIVAVVAIGAYAIVGRKSKKA